jgi:hypothetical protein
VDIVERLRVRNTPAGYLALFEDAADEIGRLRAALTEIACFDDVGANYRLAATESYGAFDEPASVQIARKALLKK